MSRDGINTFVDRDGKTTFLDRDGKTTFLDRDGKTTLLELLMHFKKSEGVTPYNGFDANIKKLLLVNPVLVKVLEIRTGVQWRERWTK